MVIKHSFSFRYLACHGWWKHKTSPPSPPKGTMRRAAQGWAQGMFPTGPVATSSPRRGAAGPWLKDALHLSAAVPYTSMGEGGCS